MEFASPVTPEVMAGNETRGSFWQRFQRLMWRLRRREPRVPFPQPPVTEDDIRRAKELVEKYGLQHLRNKP